MEPRPSQQLVVGGISINDIAGYPRLQVAYLTLEPNLPNRCRAERVKSRDNSVGGAQYALLDFEESHDRPRHNAQGGALFNLDSGDEGGPDIPCEIEWAIVHPPD